MATSLPPPWAIIIIIVVVLTGVVLGLTNTGPDAIGNEPGPIAGTDSDSGTDSTNTTNNGAAKLLGPFCHDGTCYKGETQALCTEIGATNVADKWCVLKRGNKYFDGTLLGPFCYENSCSTGSVQGFCANEGGINVADRWCFLK